MASPCPTSSATISHTPYGIGAFSRANTVSYTHLVDLDFGAERCLNDGHVGTAMQVVAVALEELMRLDAARDDKVARSRSTQTRLAKTGKTQLLGRCV